jgi:Flp pilus assembly protein TadD
MSRLAASLRAIIAVSAVAALGAVFAAGARITAAEPADDWFRQGQAEWRSMRLSDSVRSYERAIALQPTDGRPYIGLAVLYEAVDRSDLAVDVLRQLELTNPTAPHLRCRLAEAYLGAEDVSEARRLGQTATATEPDCPRAHSVFGIALVRSRFALSAARVLRRAQSLAPGDTGITEVLVEALAQQGEYAAAIREGTPLLAGDRASARVHHHLGLSYSRLPPSTEHAERAEHHLRTAASMARNWFEPNAELGRMLRAQGDVRKAIEAFEAAWAIDPTVPGVAFNLATLYRQAGDPRAESMEAATKPLTQGGGSATALRLRYNQQAPRSDTTLELARSEARSGNYAPALHRIRTLLRRDPADLEALKLYLELDRDSRRRHGNLPRPSSLAAQGDAL